MRKASIRGQGGRPKQPPLLDADHEEIPSVTVTRNVDDQDYNPTDITLDSVIVNNAHGSGLYPPNLFIAARSSNPRTKKNVEDVEVFWDGIPVQVGSPHIRDPLQEEESCQRQSNVPRRKLPLS